MSLLSDIFDGVLRKRLYTEGDQIIREVTQPSQDAIKHDNAELRKNPEVLRDLEWGQWQLCIPELDMLHLMKVNPALVHEHNPTRTAAWKAFIASPESLPYRVRHQPWR